MGCFIAGIPMTCPGGVFLFTLMEWHTASWAILLIGMGEIVIFSWVYGLDKTFDLIYEMGMKLGRAIRWFWSSVWMVITPIASVGIFIFILTDLGSTEFRGYVFPWWAGEKNILLHKGWKFFKNYFFRYDRMASWTFNTFAFHNFLHDCFDKNQRPQIFIKAYRKMGSSRG